MSDRLTQIGIDGFNAEKYWSSRKYKKWVVILEKGNGKRKQRDRIIVQSTTEEKAIACAKRHTLIKGKVHGMAFLAWPSDLGCVPTILTGEVNGNTHK